MAKEKDPLTRKIEFQNLQKDFISLSHRTLKAEDAARQLHERLQELKVKYDERGMAMRETGDMVRSLYEPRIVALKAVLQTIKQLTDEQTVIDVINSVSSEITKWPV